jgi:hypothetical protein
LAGWFAGPLALANQGVEPAKISTLALRQRGRVATTNSFLPGGLRFAISDGELRAFVGTGFDLPVVYLVWFVTLAMLYPLSLWWANIKRRRRDWWVSYL